MCILRNISYKVDKEIDRNIHSDATRVKHSQPNTPQVSRGNDSTNDDGEYDAYAIDNGSKNKNKNKEKNKKNKDRLIPQDASKTGMFPVGKIAEKAACRSVLLTIWHCILNAELTKTHSFRPFFGDFVDWYVY